MSLSSRHFPLSSSTICFEARSVIRVLITQVKRIIITTPFSISSLMRYTPGDTSRRMPTITMAMAPAAWAEVRPNIMLPSALGRRNNRLDI